MPTFPPPPPPLSPPSFLTPREGETWQNKPWADVFVRDARLVTVGDGVTVFADGKREAVHEYHVWSKYRIDSPWVKFAPGLPQPYSVYTYTFKYDAPAGSYTTIVDEAMVLVQMDVRLKEDNPDPFHHYIVTCRYSTQVPDTRVEYTDNPTKNPCRLEWDVETVTAPMEKDLDGRPFLNSAGQPFTPTPMFEQGRPVATLTNVMWAGAVTAALIESWCYVCNEDTFLGEEKGRWLALPPKCDPFHVGNVMYFRMTRKLKLAPTRQDGTKEKWDKVQILNKGVCRRNNVEGTDNYNKPVPIYGPGGPITQPVLLDTEGQPLTGLTKQFGNASVVGSTLFSAFTMEPTYETFRVRRLVKFADLFKNSYGDKQVIPAASDPAWLTLPSQQPPGKTSAPPTVPTPIPPAVPFP